MIGLVALVLLTTGETPVDPWAPVRASEPPPPAPERDPLPVAPSTTPIKHIVYIVKENRTYDNLFGRFPEGDGATTGKALDGTTIQLGPLPDKQVDLQHNHFWAVKDINDGAMNGFSATKDKAGHQTTLAYTTAGPGQLPDYWGWAHRYGLGDRMFTSVPSSSYPNHLFTVAGQTTRHPSITWNTYGAMPGQLGYGWVALDSVKRVRESVTWDQHYAPWQWFTSDVKQGHLASITWMTPPFNESDHPGGP